MSYQTCPTHHPVVAFARQAGYPFSMTLQQILARLMESAAAYSGFSTSRMTNRRRLNIQAERLPVLDGSHLDILSVNLLEQTPMGPVPGHGECTPDAAFGETIETVFHDVEALRGRIEAGMPHNELRMEMDKGAARSALDCALWDLEAKKTQTRVWALLGNQKPPHQIISATSLNCTTPEETAQAARAASASPLLRLVIPSGESVLSIVRAARNNAPQSRLIIDACGRWSAEQIGMNSLPLAGLGVEFIQQPLPPGEDGWLSDFYWGVPLCAGNSCTDTASLARIKGRYHAVNISLEKAGGLTEALALKAAAEAEGFAVIISARPATSRGLAPALLLAQGARAVDFSAIPKLGPADRHPPIHQNGHIFHPPESALWG